MKIPGDLVNTNTGLLQERRLWIVDASPKGSTAFMVVPPSSYFIEKTITSPRYFLSHPI